MPYFVRIGVIRSNQSGVGSRGYYVCRTGRTVEIKYGGVQVERGGQTTRFFWAAGWPRCLEERFSNEAEAAEWARRKIAEKLGSSEKNGNYKKLPPRRKIEKTSWW
jgi:hypothetical protein